MQHGYHEAEIEEITQSLITDYAREYQYNSPEKLSINLIDIYNTSFYPRTEVMLDMNQNLGMHDNKMVLGMTVNSEHIIYINRHIAPPFNDPRFAFTLAHEFGHALLHQKIDRCLRIDSSKPSMIRHEKEADFFASQLVMPNALVIYKFKQYYEMEKPYIYIGPGTYHINHQGVYISSLKHLAKKLAEPLTHIFSNVSKHALGIKLVSLGLIDNQTHESMYDEYEIDTMLPIKTLINNMSVKKFFT